MKKRDGVISKGFGGPRDEAAALGEELKRWRWGQVEMRPDDWLPYKARDTFNLYELACLLHGEDPERVSDAVTQELLDRHRMPGGVGRGLGPAEVVGLLEAQPRATMGDKLGGALVALKKATGSTRMQHALSRARARDLVQLLGYVWPAELGPAGDAAASAPVAMAAAARPTVTHSTSALRRSHVLDAVLDPLRAKHGDNLLPIWVELEGLARASSRPPPLAGVTSGGVRYHDGGQVKTFTKDALRSKLARSRTHANAR
ncbi:MAG: hypothetical protein QM750_23085 [Rubrivivax sp.]